MRILIISLALLVFKVLPAQNKGIYHDVNRKLKHIQEVVELTQQQEKQLKELFTQTAEQVAKLEVDSGNTPEQIRALKKHKRKELQTILSKDQLTLLNHAREQHKAELKKHHNLVREYHLKEVKPVIAQKREKFTNELSKEELAIIAEAQSLLPRKNNAKHNPKHRFHEKEDLRETRKEIRILLEPIVNTHQVQLLAIEEELRPILQAEKEFRTANRPEGFEHPQHRTRQESEKQFMYRFLLMQ